MYTFFRVHLFWILLLASSWAKAQSVDIQVVPPQGPDFRLYELWYITVINNSTSEVDGFFEVVVTDVNAGMVAFAQSSRVSLPTGVTTYNHTNYNRLEPLRNVRIDQKFEEYVLRTNALPPGQYEVCVRFFSLPDNEQLAERCYPLISDQMVPPYLISPGNESVLMSEHDVFIWSPAGGMGHNHTFNYELRVVELLGPQSPSAAIQSNPAFFFAENLNSPMMRYPASARAFRHDRKYAWQVKALIGDKVVAETEVWLFYASRSDEEEEDDEEEDSDTTLVSLSRDTYFPLSRQPVAGYYIINDDQQLYFTWRNRYAGITPEIAILNNRGEVLFQEPLEAEQKSGLNFNALDLNLYAGVQPGQIYTLVLYGQKSRQYSLRFLKSEPVSMDD